MATYNEYIAETVSEKITLAHIHCKWRPYTFTTYSGNTHQKTMDYLVSAVDQDDTSLTLAADKDSVTSGKYFFDVLTNILYVYSTDISAAEVIVTFRLFMSTTSLKLAWDMTDSGEEVYYEPRIKGTSGISIKISEEIKGLALIGNSRLVLEALDGYFDEIFEKYVWDNKEVTIYSYNRELTASQAKVVYRGVIATKAYDGNRVTFSLKDYMKLLEKNSHNLKFDSSYDVTEDVVGNFQRRIFGKVDGLKLQSIDQMGETLSLTGTLSVLQDEGTGIVWINSEDMNAGRRDGGAFGVNNASVVCGGLFNRSTFSGLDSTEKFNGQEWSDSGNLITGRLGMGYCGISSAGLIFGGLNGSYLATAEKFNGSTWSATGSLSVARRNPGGAGAQSSGLASGGSDGSGSKTLTEKFNGSTWSSTGSLNTARREHSSSGNQNDAIIAGGTGGGNSAEKFNGSTWSVIGSLNLTTTGNCSGGPGSNLSVGGDHTNLPTSASERYESPSNSWYVDGVMSISRSFPAGAGEDSTDSSLSCLISGGDGTLLIDLVSTELCTAATHSLKGSSTNFLSELTPGDLLNIENEKYEVNAIFSDINLGITNVSTVEISGETIEADLKEPYNEYNRVWSVSPKALKEFSTTFTESYSTTLFKVVDASGFRAGDILEADTATAQQREIVRVVYSQNQIQISETWNTVPTDGVTIISRPAVQSVYLQKKKVPFTLYTITNDSNGCYITFATTFERDFVTSSRLNSSFSYAKYYDSNKVFATRDETNDQPTIDKLEPRDYIQFAGQSEWLEVLNVKDNFIFLREFNSTFRFSSLTAKYVTILGDDSVVSADVYGETEEGTTTGTWIKSSSQLFKILLTEAGYGDLINDASFDNAQDTEYAMLSLATPLKSGKTGEALKTLILRVNESVNSVMTVDDELNLKYFLFDGAVDFDNMVTITDDDAIKWSEKHSNPALYSDFSSEYRFKDIDYIKESSTSSEYSFVNDFVNTYVGVDKTESSKHYLYDEIDVLSATQRQAFLSTVTPSVYSITSDLRFQNLEIGNVVKLDFLNVKSSSTPSTNKLAIVTEIKKKDETVQLTVSDLGNVFNRRSIITPDSAPDYDVATGDEKLLYSYITDDTGLMEDDEDTAGGNLII